MLRAKGTIFLGIILLILAGCGQEPPKPTKIPVPPPKPATPPAKVAPVVEEIKLERPAMVGFTYDPRGKPDPFRPLVVEKPEVPPPPPAPKVAKEPTLEGATPLERLDLSQLKLVAIIWNIKEPRAMVEDGAGKGYIITPGTNIGKNKGVVTKINSTGIVVTEPVEAPTGKISTRDVILKLYTD